MKIKEIKEIRNNIATTSTEELIALKDKLADATETTFNVLAKDPLAKGAYNYIAEVGVTFHKIDVELQTRA
jgi:hypothetical protein